jgi:CRISPR-associated endonuclease/helicase Cas3
MSKAFEREEGRAEAQKHEAHRAIIGLPGDASWNDPARFTQADEDEPGLHATLRALTRLGDPSLSVVALHPQESFDPGRGPTFEQTQAWARRTLSISRKELVLRLQALGVPEAWQKTPLLRHVYPLHLDASGRWVGDPKIHLDAALGLVFDPKEVS